MLSVLLLLCVFVSFTCISLIPMPLLWQEVFFVEAGPQHTRAEPLFTNHVS